MIIAECENDQALMHRLGITLDQIEHELGRSRALAKVDSCKEPAIGIVDEDPKASKHPIMNEYRMVEGSEGTINLRRKDNSDRWIIVIPSFFEDWLCKIAKRNKIKPSEFGLPDDPQKLHFISFNKNENARKLLIELVKTDDRELLEFKKWLNLGVCY